MFNIVHQVNVDDTTLRAIARALGVPQAEHDRIESVSGEIIIRPASRPAASTAAAQSAGSSDEHSPPKGPAGTGRSGS